MLFRPATIKDASAIAAIHTLNWQLHYREVLPDSYLDEVAPSERDTFWKTRLRQQVDKIQTIVAHDEQRITGFCCLETTLDLEAGYYLDNLHVIPEAKGRGVGKALMQKSAALLLQEKPDHKIYLWVLTGNTDAIGFYNHLGARQGRLEMISLAGNDAEALLLWWPLSEMALWV